METFMINSHSASQSLVDIWLNYDQQFHVAIKNPSTTHVHDLRIAMRRTEATLELLKTVLPKNGAKKLIVELKRTRKQLGPLRNMQVENKLLKDLGKKSVGVEYPKYLISSISKNIKNEKKRVKVFLKKRVSFKQQQNVIARIYDELFIEESITGRLKIQYRLNDAMKKTISDMKVAGQGIIIKNVSTFHRLRKKTKKFRYQKEYLNLIHGSRSTGLGPFKAIQDELGSLMDKDLLIKAVSNDLMDKKGHHKKESKILLDHVMWS